MGHPKQYMLSKYKQGFLLEINICNMLLRLINSFYQIITGIWVAVSVTCVYVLHKN